MAYIYLTNGTDTRTGTADGDYIYGYKEGSSPSDDIGNDTLYGAGGSDLIEGGGGDDKLYGDAGNDSLYGQGGNDTLDVGDDYGYAYGGLGNDIIYGGTSDDTLRGDDGDDELNGNNGSDYLVDGGYNDVSSKDKLNAGSGNDTIESNGGADTIDGGIGDDHAYIDRSSALVGLTFNFVSVAATTTLVGDGTTVTGVERFNLRTGLGNDVITTGAGADSIITGDGKDTISSGKGADYIDAGANDDAVDAGDGDDNLDGGAGNDTLDGGVGDDRLNDGSYNDVTGNDTLNGGTGYDDITSRGGVDTIDGGADADVLYLDRSYATKGLSFVLKSTSTVTTIVGDGTTVVNVERFDLYTGAGNDTVTLGDGNDSIHGNEGHDTLNGGAGIDTIYGGKGDDAINLGTQTGYAYGEDGADTIYGSESYDIIDGGIGNDKLYAGGGHDSIVDGSYSDPNGDDEIEAGAGEDSIGSFGGVDKIDGGADSDTLDLSRTTATKDLKFIFVDDAQTITLVGNGTTVASVERFNIDTGSGSDEITTGHLADRINGYDGNDKLTGNGGADSLSGGQGNDVLIGGAGYDYLEGGVGNDTLDLGDSGAHARGGTGNDIYIQSWDGNDLINEYGADGIDEVRTYYTYALLAEEEDYGTFENLTLMGTAAIDGTGNEFGNVIKGNGAKNTLIGLLGNDTLDGGAGIDRLEGGTQDDTYIVDNAGDVIIEAAADGAADRVLARASYTLKADVYVEKMTTISGSATTAIDLTGNALKQTIIGNAGANVLSTGGGAADVMQGLGGNDTYRVYNAADVILETASQGTADYVNAAVSYTLGAGVYVETLRTNSGASKVAIDLTGNALKQDIVGNAGENVLDDGGAGAADSLRGLGGNDTYRVFNSGDTIVEGAAEGTADKVFAAVSYALGGGVHVELLSTNLDSGTNKIDLAGNELAQEITGNAGSNVIDGKGGADVLRGLAGADSFLFSSALVSGNVDTIADFNVALDTIQLENDIFTAWLAPGTILPDHFRANATGEARDSTDRIIQDTDDGRLFYDPDGKGGAAGFHFATVAVGLTLTNADFVVV